MNRRGFLKVLGLGTAAGPLAAKAAVNGEIAGLSGLTKNAMTGIGAVGSYYGGPPQADCSGGLTWGQRLIGAADYVKVFGLPEHVEYSCREQSRYIHALDPDIACKRSWSMSVKLMTQRQRNYQRVINDIEKRSWMEKKKAVFEKILGYDWPW